MKQGQLGKKTRARIWEVAKYLAASSAGTAMDFALYTVLLTCDLTGRTMAFTLGRILGATVNFFLNKFLVFREKRYNPKVLAREILSYALLWVVMYFCTLQLLNLLADVLHIHELLASPLANLVMYGFGFVVQKFLVFRRPRQKDGDREGKKNDEKNKPA